MIRKTTKPSFVFSVFCLILASILLLLLLVPDSSCSSPREKVVAMTQKLNRTLNRMHQKGVKAEKYIGRNPEKVCTLTQEAYRIAERALTDVELFLSSPQGRCAQKEVPQDMDDLRTIYADMQSQIRTSRSFYQDACH